MDSSSSDHSSELQNTSSNEPVISNDDTSGDLRTSDPFMDIFGDTYGLNSTCENSLASTRTHELLFDVKQESDDSFHMTWNPGESSGITDLEKVARDKEISASSSLFDDLLDLSSPGTSEIDKILQDNTADPKQHPNVDLLLGVDNNLDSCLGQVPEVKTKDPDILDFVIISSDSPEVSSIDITESLTDGGNSTTGLSPLTPSKEKTPDIVVIISDLVSDLDNPDGNILMREKKDEKSDESINEKVAENVKQTTDESKKYTLENITERTAENKQKTFMSFKEVNEENTTNKSSEKMEEDSTENLDEKIKEETAEEHNKEDTDRRLADNIKDNNQDLDFSVLELPKASNLNFDHFKHKRSISQKGSMAHRKKPKRATLQPNSEGSIFIDSTEPKPQKSQNEDQPEKEISPDDSRGDNTQGTDNELSNKEASPSRKFVGGIKIPGLLEGLSKSKAFNKAEKKSPGAEPEDEPQVKAQVSETALEQSKTSNAAISVALTRSPPLIRPKPVVLPRVLPKPSTKTLKETQNLTTAGEGVVRASSLRIKSSAPALGEQGLFSKGQSTLSRSASVKTTTSSNILEQAKEPKTSSFNTSKPELKKPPPLPALKPVTKSPSPLSAKPTVAAKPNKINLGLSASLSGGKSPLPSTLKSEARIMNSSLAKDETDSNLPERFEESTETSNVLNTKEKPFIDLSLSKDSKSGSPSFIKDKKPFSFAEKNVQVHSTPGTPVKADTTEESKKSEDSETPKNVTLTRLPSLKKSPHSGFVATIGFKSYTNPEPRKANTIDSDDVFDSSSTSAENTNTSVNIPSSNFPLDKCDSPSVISDILQHRKSSISGISSVKSPVTSDKPSASPMPRKGSITGSAYNPIGFRSTLSSSNSEERSRGSSFSSTVEDVNSATNLLASILTPSAESRDESFGVSGGKKLRDGFNSSVSEQKKHSSDKTLDKDPSKTDGKSSTLSEARVIPIFTPKGDDDQRKETVNATNRDIREQSRSVTSSINGSPDISKDGERKTSPWNVQLKKVEKKEPLTKPEPSNKKDEPQPTNWRQQLSLRQRTPVPPKDSEKIERDNTPEWAKASIKRRQRLIDSGVIQSDT